MKGGSIIHPFANLAYDANILCELHEEIISLYLSLSPTLYTVYLYQSTVYSHLSPSSRVLGSVTADAPPVDPARPPPPAASISERMNMETGVCVCVRVCVCVCVFVHGEI